MKTKFTTLFCHAETHVKRSKYHGKSLFPWHSCCRLSDDRYAFLLCLPWLPTLMYTHCLGTRASRYLSHWDRYRDALVPCGIVSQSCIDASVCPIPCACYSRVILFFLYSHFSGWSCIPKDFKHKVNVTMHSLIYTHGLGTSASRYLSQYCIDLSVCPIRFDCHFLEILFSPYNHFFQVRDAYQENSFTTLMSRNKRPMQSVRQELTQLPIRLARMHWDFNVRLKGMWDLHYVSTVRLNLQHILGTHTSLLTRTPLGYSAERDSLGEEDSVPHSA